MNFFKKHPFWCTFLISFIIGLLVVLPSMISDSGVFTFIDDYNQQEIPFNINFNEAIKNGDTTFEFKNDLGASFIGSYSFYNIASPFAVTMWIFPPSFTPYLMGIMYALKYAVAALTAFMFLSRFVKNKKYALLGSLLYAFSGFQFANMIFYHFHDSVALFPLLLYSLDRLIKDNKKGLFVLAVALNLFTNYFFFIGQVVFVFIYYVVMNITKHYTFDLKKFGRIVLESIIGVGLGAIILIPSIEFVLSNPRIEGNWNLFSMIVPSFKNVLEVFRALLFPNDSMTFHSAINMMNYSSVEAYLPFVGSILWLTYLIKKPKNPFSILLFVLFIFMFIPILNNSFFAFTPVYYARWFYMATLIMALLSIKSLEENMNFRTGIWATGIFLLVFGLLSLIFGLSGNRYFYQGGLFLLVSVILIINIILIHFISKSKNPFKWLMIGVSIYAVIYGNYFCFGNRIMHQDKKNLIGRYDTMKETLSDLEDNVRYNHDETCERNMMFYSGKMSATSWNSNIEGSAFTFYQSIGINRDVLTKTDVMDKNLQDFLSVKYIVTCNGTNEIYDKEYKKIKQNDNIVVYENEDYIPFGIVYNYYISKEQFNTYSNDEKKDILKQAIVLDDAQIEKYKNILKPYENKQVKTTSNNFHTNKQGFTDLINTEESSLVVYTISYSKHFKALVNEKQVEVLNVDNGLIGIPISKGENKIEFIYESKPVKLGNMVSLGSLILFGGYMIVGRRKK